MPARARRRIELLQLSEPLRRYAGSLNPDVNASSFLVHQTLSTAFAELKMRRSEGLEVSLRQDIDRNWALTKTSPPTSPAS